MRCSLIGCRVESPAWEVRGESFDYEERALIFLNGGFIFASGGRLSTLLLRVVFVTL